jgi:hypothetical protein
MRQVIAALGTAVLLSACAGGSGGGGFSFDTKPSKPGNPAVYRRISNMTNCHKLQREFDTAMDNFDRGPIGTKQSDMELAYADAAHRRMSKVGCY